MYARSITLAALAATSLAFRATPASHFYLGATGAITLNVAGEDARYGLVPTEVNGRPMILVSLGAAASQGALSLYLPGDRVPQSGRYPIHEAWDNEGSGDLPLNASFVAGSPEHPLGWFQGERGWVTITRAESGRLSGEFEIQARGFTSASPDDENRWITVRGTFQARGDSGIGTIASRQ